MTPRDAACALGRSLVRHGPHSDRAYLVRLHPEDHPGIVQSLDELARTHNYSKIFARVPQSLAKAFLDAGYVAEALVPDFFPLPHGRGREPGCFLGRFLAPWREQEEDPGRVLEILRSAVARGRAQPGADVPVERMGPGDAEEMASLFSDVFASYPIPVFDPEYLREHLAEHAACYGVRLDGKLAALAACEADESLGHAEMTDFAVRPEARGQGLAQALLNHMEARMAGAGVFSAFTIARARSLGMNVVFARQGYAYAGTLIRNTNISGSLESMHVWCKDLSNHKIT